VDWRSGWKHKVLPLHSSRTGFSPSGVTLENARRERDSLKPVLLMRVAPNTAKIVSVFE
jgi:hypothetical protein